MAIQNKPLSLEEMRAELRQVLWSFAGSLGRVYGNRRSDALLLPPGFSSKDFENLEIDSFDLDSIPITGHMEVLYEYAINGIKTITDLTDDYEDARDFFRGLDGFDLLWENVESEGASIKKCTQVVEMANARLVLDEGGMASMPDGGALMNHLSLSQVAILAGLDERTVRNATTPKAKDRLATVNVGGRTYVDNDVAIEWLKRRGFKETVLATQGHRRDPKNGFHSAADLGAFVAESRVALGMGPAELAERANVEEPWLASLEAGDLVFDKQGCLNLAQALNLDPKDFTLAAFWVHQGQASARIKAELL